tara:strand:- start:4409 stop:4591 length:183 start_codon:yes stop_codon:yes gene_type:complete
MAIDNSLYVGLLEEKQQWSDKLDLALDDENYRLCALYRDKIKAIDKKIMNIIYPTNNLIR